MASLIEQSKSLAKRLEAIPTDILLQLRPTLIKAGEDVATSMRSLAESSRDSGALIASIEVTGPGGTTPAYAAGGGSTTAGANQVLITAGNPDVRYGHLVEFGTVNAPAQPFMRPGFRLAKARVQAAINRAIGKVIKKAGGS